MNHYRKTMQKYRGRQRADGCPFCLEATVAKSIYQTPSMYVVANLTQYDLWELHDVVDHLLIVPKRHVKSLSELTDAERLGIMNVIVEYELKGYSAYARGVGFVKRSVEHQHTHLIKTTNAKPRVFFFLDKPYTLLKF